MMEEVDQSEHKEGPIGDVGEKFSGARKDNPSPDFIGNIQGIKSNSSVVKKDIWPKPNFREDVKLGKKTAKHALLFTLVYGNLANKPLGGGWFKLNQEQWDEAYIATMQYFKDQYENGFYEKLDYLSDDFNSYMELKFKNRNNDIIEKYASGKHTKRRVKHPLNFDLETSIRLRNLVHLGWPNENILDTDNYGATKLIDTKTREEKWFAVKAISAKRVQTLDGWTEYDTYSDALAAVKERFKLITDEREVKPEKKERSKPPRRPRFDRDHIREGEDYRAGKDISAQELMSIFKFRGVEFGNWVNQKERQWFLNSTHDSLMDLVDLMGLPATFASLGGKLGIAFGSRGTGVDGAAAHFEPGNMLIHLTKTQGVGVLAHEFGHGLDNILATRNGLDSDFFSGHFLKTSKYNYYVQNHTDQHLIDLKDGQPTKHFLKLLNYLTNRSTSYLSNDESPMFNGTSFMNNALTLDEARSQYWSEPTEIFARLFECWVTDQLAENDRINEFLVYGTEESAQSWNMKISAYPTGRERAILVDLMDEWIRELVEFWLKKR